jgi:hypothetical protein
LELILGDFARADTTRLVILGCNLGPIMYRHRSFSLRPNQTYSILSACTGSMDAARRAGITPATQAAASSIPTATANALLLTVVISYSCDFTNRTP